MSSCASQECGEKSGMCPFCGNGNACCRKDETDDAPRECQGSLSFTTWHHECVVPIHSTSSELFQKLASVGAEAASQAAKKGMSPEQQVGGACVFVILQELVGFICCFVVGDGFAAFQAIFGYEQNAVGSLLLEPGNFPWSSQDPVVQNGELHASQKMV